MIKHLLFYSIIAAPLASLAAVDLTGVYDIGTLTPLKGRRLMVTIFI